MNCCRNFVKDSFGIDPEKTPEIYLRILLDNLTQITSEMSLWVLQKILHRFLQRHFQKNLLGISFHKLFKIKNLFRNSTWFSITNSILLLDRHSKQIFHGLVKKSFEEFLQKFLQCSRVSSIHLLSNCSIPSFLSETVPPVILLENLSRISTSKDLKTHFTVSSDFFFQNGNSSWDSLNN